MKPIKLIFVVIFFLSVSYISGQEMYRKDFRLPEEIFGYKVLKCDFHLHTVFSDGLVWPTVRVSEAVLEGLDAIAITDHIESRPIMQSVNVADKMSHDLGYKLAKPAAEASGIILIPAVEITKEVPPGHFNALFINDFNRFAETMDLEHPRDGSFIRKALDEARRQNAFIFWNHPWYQVPNSESIWFPIIDSLYNEGYIDGIEVVNATKYDPIILGWVQSKNLANIANSDLHRSSDYGGESRVRTMTIVFAKERSAESIREALDNRRSVSYCYGGMMIGDKHFLNEMFHRSVEIKAEGDGKNSGVLIIRNNSSIQFDLQFINRDGLRISTFTGGLTVPPLGETAVNISYSEGFAQRNVFNIGIKVNNFEVAPDTRLETSFQITMKKNVN